MKPVRAHGYIRRTQAIYLYGPGAFVDLPQHSVIVGGLDAWPPPRYLEEIDEPRLADLLAHDGRRPKLYAPPVVSGWPHGRDERGIVAYRFPEWFVVQRVEQRDDGTRVRRLVHARHLDRGRFEGKPVVAVRFVRTCPRGHVADIEWHDFVHGPGDSHRGDLYLVERGTTGDLADLAVECSCGKRRSILEARGAKGWTADEAARDGEGSDAPAQEGDESAAASPEGDESAEAVPAEAGESAEAARLGPPLGWCPGQRPWLGPRAGEKCHERARLLVRTAANAYFPVVYHVLSLPHTQRPVDAFVDEHWQLFRRVENREKLSAVLVLLADEFPDGIPFGEDELMAAIERRRKGGGDGRAPKIAELDALLSVPEGYGEDVPIDERFHARRLPRRVWDPHGAWPGIAQVVQVHRLRVVSALVGFTRLEPILPDLEGGFGEDVQFAAIAEEPSWYPAVENKGEGIFVLLSTQAVGAWAGRAGVAARGKVLKEGHDRHWADARPTRYAFPGLPYVLLHTLSHLLIEAVALRAGYPAAAIAERIYVDYEGRRFGLLLYTASPDAHGTLGGLVQEARHLADHLRHAVQLASVCSNDPVCAQHEPSSPLERRYLHGAACHACTLIAEPSCEARNEYLDRALVAPIIGCDGAAFFGAP